MRDNLDRPCGCGCRPDRFWADAIVMASSCFIGFTLAAFFAWFVFFSVWPW